MKTLEQLAREAGMEYEPHGDEWVDGGRFGSDGVSLENLARFRAACRAEALEEAANDKADALRFRWLCEHPDWHFIEALCREFVADSSVEFLSELRRVIDVRRSVELGAFEQHAAIREMK